MKFEKAFEVLSTDVGYHSAARVSAVLRYLQEAAVHQMLCEKPTYRELWEQGLRFVISRLQLNLYHPVYEYETLTAQTWACNEKGVSYGRCYRLLRGDEVVAEAVAVWALLDVKNQTLKRVGEIDCHYGQDEPLDFTSRCVVPRVTLQEKAVRTVQYEDIDCNGHLNNTRYPDWLLNLLPNMEHTQVTDINLHYVNEAKLGETVTLCHGTADDGNTHVFETRLADGRCNVRAVMHTKEWNG